MSAYQPPTDPTAVAPRRIVAALIDVGIGAVIGIVLFLALSEQVTQYNSFSQTYQSTRRVTGGGALLFYGAWLAYNLGVFVVQRGLSGRTLGTSAMGLVTVNAQGKPLGVGYALLRSVAGVVDYIGCGIPALVGMITMFSTKGHRRVGDMAASSYVVGKQYAGRPLAIPGVTGPASTGPYGQPYGTPGQAPYRQAPYGQAPYGQAPYGQAPYGQAPYGQAPYGQAPGQQAPPATNIYGEPEGPPQFNEALYGSQTGTAPAPSAPEPAADPTTPQWDPQRNAYLQWDPAGQRWMQFDDASQQWRPA